MPLAPTANAGGTVTPGQLQAGAADRILDIPVGTALGGYTARAGFLGSAGVVDTRKVEIAGTFNPSIGVDAAPRVKAVALTAGGETVVIIKADVDLRLRGHALRSRAAPRSEFAGKVILASSHSHSAWAQHTRRPAQARRRRVPRDRLQPLPRRVRAAPRATRSRIAATRRSASSTTATSIRPNQINHDRRAENDMLPGGNVKDNHFYMIRDRRHGRRADRGDPDLRRARHAQRRGQPARLDRRAGRARARDAGAVRRRRSSSCTCRAPAATTRRSGTAASTATCTPAR